VETGVSTTQSTEVRKGVLAESTMPWKEQDPGAIGEGREVKS